LRLEVEKLSVIGYCSTNSTEIKDLKEDIKKLMIDIAIIKRMLLNETELTGWAKKELKKAREEKESGYVSLEAL